MDLLNAAQVKTFELPNGFIDSAGVLQTSITLRKMDGTDEDFLRDKDEISKGPVLDTFLCRNIVELGGMTEPKTIYDVYQQSMLMADASFVLVKYREFSLGPKYVFDYQCPHCGKWTRHKMMLDELKVTKQPQEYRGSQRIVLDVFGHSVEAKQLVNSMSKMFTSIKQQYPKMRETYELMLQLEKVDGRIWRAPEVAKWPTEFRNALRNALESTTGGIDTEMEMKCGNVDCERTFREVFSTRGFRRMPRRGRRNHSDSLGRHRPPRNKVGLVP